MSPLDISRTFESCITKELSAAIQIVTEGSWMKIVSPYRFGIGVRHRQRFIAVSCTTGHVVWMKKPTLWANHDGEPKVATFGAQLYKMPKGAYKAERLVGVIPEAAQVSTDAERSFILALEGAQLVLVASDLATKRAWLAACFTVLERKANAMSLIANAAMAAAVMDASTKAKAVELKAVADLKADMERGRAQLHMQMNRHVRVTAYASAAGVLPKQERTCVVCYDVYQGCDDGIECGGSEPHFMCNECMLASVQSSISDDLSKQDLRGGRLACPFRTFPHTKGSCDAPCYEDRVVAKKVDATTFEAYLQARAKLVEAKIARETSEEMERQIAAAVKQMDAEGPDVFQTQKYICDEILTIRCPRCKLAITHLDGCYALSYTCTSCGCNFCALCRNDCGGGVQFGEKKIQRRGDDAVHMHLRKCKYAKGIGNGNDGRVQSQVWNKIRKDRIEDCLKTMCKDVDQRQKVVNNLKKQFDDLDLAIAVPGRASMFSTLGRFRRSV